MNTETGLLENLLANPRFGKLLAQFIVFYVTLQADPQLSWKLLIITSPWPRVLVGVLY